MLGGVQASLCVGKVDRVRTISDVGFQVFSQYDEDGIIEWLVQRLPDIPPHFVEFGVESYVEANTRFLLYHRNWRGLVMDGSHQNISAIKSRATFWKHDLNAIHAFIDKDNINDLIRENGFDGEIGLLSIDIDGNDYWVWKEINACRPWLVIVEYNATLGDQHALVVPYDAKFERIKAHPSGLYHGASIAALKRLGEEIGYTLLGSNRAGDNAFFIRRDLLVLLGEGCIIDKAPFPAIYRESRDASGNLNYVRAIERNRVISDLPILDLESGRAAKLSDFRNCYSAQWRNIMGEST